MIMKIINKETINSIKKNIKKIRPRALRLLACLMTM
jgi:hypothetical protein